MTTKENVTASETKASVAIPFLSKGGSLLLLNSQASIPQKLEETV
jgi:hypothetical protein